MRLLRVILVLGACFHLTGGHWGVLQGIAWAKMLVEYSSQDGLLEGARKTFDGAHPCGLCRSIAAAKESEKQTDPLTSKTRDLELKPVPVPLPARLVDAFGSGHDRGPVPEPAGLPASVPSAPPSPPPRAAA